MPRVRAAPAARAALLATLVGSALASRGAGESCPSSTEDDAAGLAQVRVRQLHRQAPAPAPECELLTRPDGAGGSLSLPAAQACLDLVRGPALRAKQHMQALARYYKSFYTFALIASDPTAGNYTFDPAFADLGIFGGANGGAPADLSRVDLVGDWQKIADGIPAEGTYPIKNWVAPANAAFHKLRDCHPDIWGEGIVPVALLNVFNLMLTDMRDEGVSIQISADQEKANINGELKPIVMERKHGSVIKSIDQQSPFRWLTENLALSSTFADNKYCIKSLGGRMNQVVGDVRAKGGGISYGLGGLGPLGGLNSGRVSVEFEGGDNASWVWRVALNYDSLLDFGCMNFACLVDKAPKLLNRSFHYGQLVELTTNSLNESWSSEALSMLFAETAPRRAAPSLPNAAPEGASLPDDVFAWIGDPSATLGYLAFRNRSDGTEFGLLKITTFRLKLGERDITFELAEVMAKEWGKFVTEAQIRGVTRLLVDVVHNSGGHVTLAYDFVQMMMPELTYRQTCGSFQRPIPRAYNLWSKINNLPVEQFLSSELGSGFQADRRAALEADPDHAEAVLNNIRALLRAMESFEQPLANITSILAELAPGHVTWEAAWTGFESLVSMYKNGQCANPFFDDSQYETAYEHPQLEQRGKYTRNFTARTYSCPTNAPSGLAHPFEDIIFVSDGYCGSSCYLAAHTIWATARAWSNRSVRFATWGGIGGSAEENKKTLSPTAFAGGSVDGDGDKMVTRIFNCLLVQLGLASAVGSRELTSQLFEVWNEMTSNVPLYSWLKLPAFTDSEVYQPAFGKNAPPGEYVFTPTDLVLPTWFSGVSGTNASFWNVTQLDAMHQMAAQAFE